MKRNLLLLVLGLLTLGATSFAQSDNVPQAVKETFTKQYPAAENTEKSITYDQLPDAVKDGFLKSKYADREVEETKIIYRAGGTERYRLKTRKNDLQKKYLYFNEKGQLVEDSITI